MTEEVQNNHTDNVMKNKKVKSLYTAILGTSIIFWVISIFIINSINKMNDSIENLNRRLEMLNTQMSLQTPSAYQVVDPQGRVVYKFQLDPALMCNPEEEPMDGTPQMENNPEMAPKKEGSMEL